MEDTHLHWGIMVGFLEKVSERVCVCGGVYSSQREQAVPGKGAWKWYGSSRGSQRV